MGKTNFMKNRNLLRVIAAVTAAWLLSGCSDTASGQAAKATAQEAASVSKPQMTDFTVYDLSGEEMKLSELTASNKVTMLNFWGTFCGPCLREMPDLAEIEKKYKNEGFEIIGVTIDAVDYESGKILPDIADDAKDIIGQTGVEYPVIITSNELLKYTGLTAVPTTYFVDSEGNLLSEPLVGSKSYEDWEKIITEML